MSGESQAVQGGEEGCEDEDGDVDEEVEIVLGACRFPGVPRRLLEAQSEFFGALRRSGMQGCRGREQHLLGGLSAEGLRLVVGFVCTSRLEGDLEGEGGGHPLLAELVQAASYLQVTPLLRHLCHLLSLSNCLELHRLAQLHGLWELQDTCLAFMAASFHRLLSRLPPCDPLRPLLRIHRTRGTPVLLALGTFHGHDACTLLSYREATRCWTPLPDDPPPHLQDVRGYGATVLDNYLFVVGGYRLAGHEISAAHCYNPCLDCWTQVASMNQKRSNFKLLAVDGKLYAIGGQFLSNVECYSPEHDWWNFVAPLPSPLAEFSACECQGKIYVMGGYTTRERNLNILQYCPSSDIWTNVDVCNVHLRKQQMLSVEDTIYVVGGCSHELGPNKKSAQNEDMLTVRSYNVATKEWLYLKENTSKSGLNLTCTLHNDGIYILSRDFTLSTSLEHRVFLKYNIFSDRWESLKQFPTFGQNILVCSLYLPNLV